jgi:hypothetical protein
MKPDEQSCSWDLARGLVVLRLGVVPPHGLVEAEVEDGEEAVMGVLVLA